jgi:septum formation protein
MKNIILASGSPRRKMLMEWAELNFEIIVSDVDESFPNDISPKDVALLIAKNKNIAVFEKLQLLQPTNNFLVISADTIVVLNGEIIGKPANREHAIEILQKLSGQKHEVITAVVMKNNLKEIAFADATQVTFHDLTPEQIVFYVDNYKPYDKAGAYAIQEWIGVVGIKSIEGDFYNVMGLPISRVVSLLNSSFID